MESNRNLSSIISKIRDEGPPVSGAVSPPADPVSTGPGPAGDAQPRATATCASGHRISRKLLLGLPLVLIIGLVMFAGSYTGYRDDGTSAGVTGILRGWFAGATDVAEKGGLAGDSTIADVAVDEQLVRELRARQLEIMARLDQLSDTVTALSETADKNWADNDTVIAGLRQEQQADIDGLESRVVALQRRIAGTVDKPGASEEVASSKPAAQTKQAASASPAAQTKKVVPARPVAQKQAAPAEPAVRDMAEQPVAGEDWVVNVASSSHEQAMVELAAKLREQGIPVERQTLTIEGDLMYRLRVPGFTTSEEARSYAKRLDKEFGLRGGWISRK